MAPLTAKSSSLHVSRDSVELINLSTFVTTHNITCKDDDTTFSTDLALQPYPVYFTGHSTWPTYGILCASDVTHKTSIGLGEVVRRIIGKSVMQTIKHNLQDTVRFLQLSVGQDVGCEAAFHALKQIFAEYDTEAVILVDATNAIENLNRQVTLRNCRAIMSLRACILTNTHRNDSWLFAGGQCMHEVQRGYNPRGPFIAMAI